MVTASCWETASHNFSYLLLGNSCPIGRTGRNKFTPDVNVTLELAHLLEFSLPSIGTEILSRESSSQTADRDRLHVGKALILTPDWTSSVQTVLI